MKLPENVETETSDKSGFNSRASRMARYSAAAAGVAAVSTLDVDAALVRMDLGSPVGAGTPINLHSPDFSTNLIFFQGGSSSYVGPDYISAGNNSSDPTIWVVAGTWFGPNSQIGTSIQGSYGGEGGSYGGEGGSYGGEGGYSSNSVGWAQGGAIGLNGTNETLYMGFYHSISYSNYNYGYLQFDFDSAQTATVQHWGYESVFNTAVTTPGGSSSVPDTGPGLFGLALLGAGAAGVRLLRKLRSKS